MKSKSLFAIEIISTAFAYKILNEVLQNSWVEVVEISSGASAKNFLLFQADDLQKLKTLHERFGDKYGQPSRRILEIFSPQIFDFCLIENAHPALLPSLISLEQNPIDQGLIIFETESICACLTALDQSLKTFALKICDVKFSRQSGGMNQIFLTGASQNCVDGGEALKQLLYANYLVGNVEVLSAPEAGVKEFFHLT